MAFKYLKRKFNNKQSFVKLLFVFLFITAICVALKYVPGSPSVLPVRIYDPLDNKVVPSFSLLDQHGKEHELNYYRKRNAVVIISHGIGCPIFRQSIEEIKRLKEKFNSEGVEFLLLNANPQDSFEDLLKEAKTYGLDFSILKDTEQLVARELGLTRTAEAVVIDPVRWQIVYRGAIDDSQSYSGQLQANVNHYLSDVLEQFLRGERVKISNTAVSGCLINFLPLEKVEASQLSYVKDIAPIFQNKCFSCHQPNNVAPWAMSDYQTVLGWGAMIKEVVLSNRMPPWQIDPRYGEFENPLSLTSEEKIKVVTWIDSGLSRGEGEDPLSLANSRVQLENSKKTSKWSRGEPDFVVDFPVEKIPATGLLEYRYGLVKLQNPEDSWLSAVEVIPSNKQVAHHIIVSKASPGDDPQNKLPQDTSSFYGAYTTGYSMFSMPADTGLFMPKDINLIVQQHFVSIGVPETCQTEVGYYLSKTKPKYELKISAVADEEFEIERDSRQTIRKAKPIKNDIVIFDLQPHAHYRARSARYIVEFPDGKQKTLLSVPKYSFNWQFLYRLKEPQQIPAGSKLICEIEYDNTQDNPNNPDPSKDIKYGLMSTDEMFLCYYSYIEAKL